MLLSEYIKIVVSTVIKEDKGLSDQELLLLLKRVVYDIGQEELSWFVRDKDFVGLTQQILEMIEYGIPKKPQKWLELVSTKSYDKICQLIQLAVERATGISMVCSPKIIEHFFYSRRHGV